MSPVSQQPMPHIAALVSTVVASPPTVLPVNNLRAAKGRSTHPRTCSSISTAISLRVRERAERSRLRSPRPLPSKWRTTNESVARQAMPRSESMPSKYLTRLRQTGRPFSFDQLLEPCIEGLSGRGRQLLSGDPQCLLPVPLLACSQHHTQFTVTLHVRISAGSGEQ